MTRSDAAAALLHRLRQAAAHFPLTPEEADELARRGKGPLLSRLAQLAQQQIGTDLTWLLIVATTATFPTASEFRRVHRALRIADPALAHRAVLEAAYRHPVDHAVMDARLDVVAGAVIVDVDFCAKHAHNTGIQRVVRQTMARWSRDRDVLPVAWTDGVEAMRRLTPVEHARVTAYGSPPPTEPDGPLALVVPWRSRVIVPEVPQRALCAPLEALAEYSGNAVGLVGHDAIPVISADTVPDAETDRFVDYLAFVKHADRVAGVSRAAAGEFAGFAHAVSAQGLSGPSTVAVPLPVDVPDAPVHPIDEPGKSAPSILVVGSHEPRKNHYAVLHAAELLWRDGLEFSLTFLGTGSLWYTRRFDHDVQQLRDRGRAVEVLRGVDDARLLRAYRTADFTVFPSLHEGFGLPVAESLALGIPVVTTAYGSTAEIAEPGGCLVVDPRDDLALFEAMRSLIVDPALLERLRIEIAARPSRTWDDYAAELWEQLVEQLEVSDATR